MSHPLLMKYSQQKVRRDLPDFGPGDTVRVHVKIKEGDKERIQVFEGVVLYRRGSGLSETFCVRKISFGVGVERIFPINSPVIDKIEVVRRGRVRRARLYYLRELRGKAARIKEKREFGPQIPETKLPAEPVSSEAAGQAEETTTGSTS